MVKRLTGLNPLAYLGVDPSTPADTVQSDRSPTSNDTNFVIGTVWLTINKTGPVYEVWQLMNLAGGEATWVQLYPGSGGSGAVNFITNSGTAVESAGTITIDGGSNINTSGAGSTVTVNLDNTVSISGQFTAHGDIVSSTGNIVASAGQLACLGDALVGGTLTVDSMANGAVFADAGGALSATNGTNGQLIIGGGTTPLWANITSTDGTITITNGANSINIDSPGALPIKTTKFTSSGTWTKTTGTQWIAVYLWAGGWGGGSGRRGASTAAGGGAGGNQGHVIFYEGPVSSFFDSGTVTVGAGGTGGAAITTNNTNGNSGGTSGFSRFNGLITSSANAAIPGGTTTTASPTPGDAMFNGYAATIFTPSGGTGSNTDGVNGDPSQVIGKQLFLTGTPGGGGAGADTGTPRQGGNGGAITFINGIPEYLGAAGGIETGTIDGSAGLPSPTHSASLFGGQGGGGGGGQSSGLVAGNGGAGGIPGGGGGGGGGSLNGTNSGAGGDGARGEVWVIEFF